MTTEIKTSINNNPLTGLSQEVVIAQISYMDFDIKEAKIKFRINQLDKNGNRLGFPMTSHEVFETLTNSNILTLEGITINESNFPIFEDESDELYQMRLSKMKEKGIPEFDFWVSPLSSVLSMALENGKHLLNLEL